ncbi:hypothetical protein CPB86DRAFT_409940 [Serendipita vermifera]|nr:hypothetical protein CPB86DRAFT_409940 [Serendipita vermifera]
MGSISLSTALVHRRNDNSLTMASPYKRERILDKAICSVGSAVGKKMDQLARGTGWGPAKTTERILGILEQGERGRERALERLYAFFKEEGFRKRHEFSILEMECINLMKYTLPVESASTQLVAFQQIVLLITHYPCLRHFFLRFQKVERIADSEISILAMWKRKSNTENHQWLFYGKLAAASITKGEITTLMESTPPREIVVITEEGGVIDWLLRLLNCYNAYEIPCALGIRYLGAILEFPEFWQKPRSISHQHIVQQLLRVLIRLLQDLGIECDASYDSNLGAITDNEGIDILIKTSLKGVQIWIQICGLKHQVNQPW